MVRLMLEQNLRCQVAEGFISRPGTRLQGVLLGTLVVYPLYIGYIVGISPL